MHLRDVCSWKLYENSWLCIADWKLNLTGTSNKKKICIIWWRNVGGICHSKPGMCTNTHCEKKILNPVNQFFGTSGTFYLLSEGRGWVEIVKNQNYIIGGEGMGWNCQKSEFFISYGCQSDLLFTCTKQTPPPVIGYFYRTAPSDGGYLSVTRTQFLSPPVQVARWAHMHRFLSVVCL